jgi:uncharacterized protein YndB with AHSA1/START domain
MEDLRVSTSRTSRVIKAPREALYRAFQAISFDSVDPAFSGKMTMVVTFEETDGGTEVTIVFEHIPSGIRPEDNEAGCRSSLEKLARYLE